MKKICKTASQLIAAAALVAAAAVPVRAASPIPGNPRYVFQAMGEDSGLATRTANSLLQDRDGFIWFGGMDGVYRFDGAEFVLFDEARGLPATNVTQIAEDPRGRIWAVASGEIAVFAGGRFSRLNLSANRTDPGVDVRQRLAIDADGSVYLANRDEILALDPETLAPSRSWKLRDGLPPGDVRALFADGGRLWFVVGHRAGYLEIGSGEITVLGSEGMPRDGAIAILVDGHGVTWVRSVNHLAKWDQRLARFVRDDVGLAEAPADGIPSLDREGRLLVPTRSGLFIRDREGWRVVSARNGLPSNAVASATEDREGALWIGLYGAGIYRWSWRRRWLAWTSEEGLPDDAVWGSLRDDAGRLWVGTNDGIGVWLPAEERWRTIQRADGLAGYAVWKLAIGPEGRVWSISRRAGLNRYDPESLDPEPVPLPPCCPGEPVEMARGNDGELLIGGKGYLARISGWDAEPVVEPIALPESLAGATESISVTADGAVWIAGRGGLGRFHAGEWRAFDTDDGLRKNRLMNVAAISAREAWVGYEGAEGITRLEIDGALVHTEHLGKRDGLLSDAVWLLERDRLGRLWVAGSDGVSVVLPDGRIHGWDQSDGLIWNDVGQDALWVEADGSAFIGTSRGLAYHDPSADRDVENPPNVVLTEALLGGIQHLGEREVSVSYRENTFFARYSGLTFRKPSRVVFKYRLVGLEDEWIRTDQRQVRYPALGAGSYRFEVFCRSAAGTWSEEPASFSFAVRAPWWERWWFRMAVGAALFLAVIGILQIRTHRLEVIRRRLEAAVADRSAKLAEANAELREMSLTDALTKVRNRRFFADTIPGEVAKTLRRHDPRSSYPDETNRDLVFLIIDIDHFKRVNDEHGHLTGDRVLVETARRIEASVRRSDMVVRWGGEEFLVVLRDASRGDARIAARRIMEMVGGSPLVEDDGLSVGRTCSVGWAVLPALVTRPAILAHEQVLELADKALYLAKQEGRNRAVGVELIDEAFADRDDTSWIDRDLTEVEGELLGLIRITGP
jgi:diguanylate cyclase (GGDEF)-like protein